MQFAHEPGSYHPRACDCDFCRKNAAAYVSDPQGSLGIRVQDARCLGNYRQGSGVAECIFCAKCGVLIGDRKSTRLNSSHPSISYAVFCLKKKKTKNYETVPQLTY